MIGANKPFQLYLKTFGDFLENIDEDSLGHAYVDGPREKIKELIKTLSKSLG